MYCKGTTREPRGDHVGTTWLTRGKHVHIDVYAQPRGRCVESFFRVKSQKDSAIGTKNPCFQQKSSNKP